MLEPISDEEYELSKEKLKNLEHDLFDVKYEIYNSSDKDKINLLKRKVAIIKREMLRTKFDIKVYNYFKGGKRVK